MNGISLTEELKATLNQFYVYAYIRQRNSPIGNAGTPYYIGKGKDSRAWVKHGKTPVPKDISRIIIVGHNLTEEEAFTLEVKMIADYGRVDNNTGILRNRTDGGDGSSGAIHTEETRRILSEAAKGKIPWNKGKTPTDATKLQISKANKGRIHITDGINNKIIHPTDIIPSGWRKGLSLTDASKLLISKANKGKTATDATKLLMSKAHKGKIPWNKGKTATDARKLQLSKANKGKIHITDGINNRVMHPTDPIPSGWRKGRSYRRNTVASGSDIYAFLDGTS